jgi:hypothetical protein
LADVAPHLFHLRPGHDYADIFFRLGWRNAWGILLATEADQSLLYRHLRTLLRVRSEKKRLVFRYYDPRILRQYLPTCTSAELDRFFGPISSVVVEAEEPHRFHLFRRGAAGFEHLRFEKDSAPVQAQNWPVAEAGAQRGPLVLRQGQLETLTDPALRAFQDRMIDWIRRDFEDDFQRLQEKGVRRLVMKAKASAATYGMGSAAEVTGLLSLILVLQDEDFETREENEWMLAILRSPSIPGGQKFRMILQQELESI